MKFAIAMNRIKFSGLTETEMSAICDDVNLSSKRNGVVNHSQPLESIMTLLFNGGVK